MSLIDSISSMDRRSLANYISGLIKEIERSDWCNEQAGILIALLKRVLMELGQEEHNLSIPTYKVCYKSGNKEYNVTYCSSLSKAKRILRQRFIALKKSPDVAMEFEIEEYGVEGGFLPSTRKIVISNRDMRVARPGRFKFYEVRMESDEKVVPVQLILTQVCKNEESALQSGNVMPFPASRGV